VRIIAVEDHRPEYGTIVVRDTYGVELAGRLPAAEEEIHGTVRCGTERGLLSTSGGEGGLTVMPRLPPTPS
jgi:hypothetical protein